MDSCKYYCEIQDSELVVLGKYEGTDEILSTMKIGLEHLGDHDPKEGIYTIYVIDSETNSTSLLTAEICN